MLRDANAVCKRKTGEGLPMRVIKGVKVGGSTEIFARLAAHGTTSGGALKQGASVAADGAEGSSGASDVAIGFCLLAGAVKPSRSPERSCERLVRNALAHTHKGIKIMDGEDVDGGCLAHAGRGIMVDGDPVVVTDIDKLQQVHRALRAEWRRVVATHGAGSFWTSGPKSQFASRKSIALVNDIGMKWTVACAQLVGARSGNVLNVGVGGANVRDKESCDSQFKPSPQHRALHSVVCYMMLVVSRADYDHYFAAV